MSSSSIRLLPITPSRNTNLGIRIQKIDLEIKKLINDAIQEFAQLPDEIVVVCPLRSAVQEKYGDYLCMNIFTIWEGLKRKDSKLCRENTPRSIAQGILEVIKKNNPKMGNNCKMLQELSLRYVGYITCKLSIEWMNERIRKMLKDGIDTWAPIIKLESVLITVPSASEEVDMRSLCLANMLMRIFDYVGVAVDRGYRGNTPESSNEVAECFYIQQGAMISKRNKAPVFIGVSFNHAYNDLRTLWTAIHQQRAQWIVFITPARQRNYVKKLFNVAKDEHWVRVGEYPILICCGYRVLREQDKLSSLSQKLRCHSKFPSFEKLSEAAGYNVSTSFQCAIAYTYLKNYRLAEVTFNLDEILDEEGDSFVYLLKTQAIFSLLDKNFGSRGMVSYTKAFFRKERELAVHLVQFTDVIYTACVRLELHRVCEYLFSLCKKFTSYYEVLMQLDLKVFESKLLLSNATKVVMKKCFDLLGISPDSKELSSSGLDFKTNGFDVIPFCICDDARNKRSSNLNPRFEMLCMNIYIPHFKTFDVFGIVSLKDSDGLLFDRRLPLNTDENGYVSYFFKDWYEPVSIRNNGFFFFENPRPPYSPPFASLLEIYLRLYATSSDNKCVLLCNKHYPIDLSDFWAGKQDYKRGTLVYESLVASIDFEYIALRDAIDTSMELSFDSPSPNLKASVKGHIFAYYDGTRDGLEGLKQCCYKALLFQANDLTVKVGPVTMKRSVLAVPADGALIIEALFLDVNTGEVILNSKRRLDPKPIGSSKCRLPWKNCFFNLTVKWSKGPKYSYT